MTDLWPNIGLSPRFEGIKVFCSARPRVDARHGTQPQSIDFAAAAMRSVPEGRFGSVMTARAPAASASRAIASAVRRYKSEQNLGLGKELNRLQLAPNSPALAFGLVGATQDLMSVTRARQVEVSASLAPGLTELTCGDEGVKVGIEVEIQDS